MKKITIGLLIIISLFITVGCGKIANEFIMKDVVLRFDKETFFKNIKYKNAKEIVPVESGQVAYLEYTNKDVYDGRFVFRISLAYSDEITLDEYLGDKESEDVKVNGINWKKVRISSISDTKETTSINYLTEKDEKIYIVSILAFNETGFDINRLSDIFISGVTIK